MHFRFLWVFVAGSSFLLHTEEHSIACCTTVYLFTSWTMSWLFSSLGQLCFFGHAPWLAGPQFPDQESVPDLGITAPSVKVQSPTHWISRGTNSLGQFWIKVLQAFVCKFSCGQGFFSSVGWIPGTVITGSYCKVVVSLVRNCQTVFTRLLFMRICEAVPTLSSTTDRSFCLGEKKESVAGLMWKVACFFSYPG